MTHDPFQTYPTFGAYSTVNPAASAQPFGQPGYPVSQQPYGVGGLQPQQLAQAMAAQAVIPQAFGQSPFTAALQNPLVAAILQHQLLQNQLLQSQIQQNPLVQNPLLQNPLQQNPFQQNPHIAAAWQQPQAQYPQTGYGSPYGQSPYGVSPFGPAAYGLGGAQLAPQSWVGQGIGQIHPLLTQLGARAFQMPGVSPWAYF